MGWFRRLLTRIAPRRVPALSVVDDYGAGPVVVMLHGIASNAVTFAEIAPALHGRRRITIDLLGFGASPPGADYTVDEHVAAIRRTVKALGLRTPFTLVGHSLGGLLAARYAARYGGLSRLVLISPPVYLPPDLIGDPIDSARMGILLSAYQFLRANKDFSIRGAARTAALLRLGTTLEITEGNWDAFRLSLEHAIESQTTIADIAAVRAPIELVYGTLDQFTVPGTLRVIERMEHVHSHAVLHDHTVRGSLARAAIAAILADR